MLGGNLRKSSPAFPKSEQGQLPCSSTNSCMFSCLRTISSCLVSADLLGRPCCISLIWPSIALFSVIFLSTENFSGIVSSPPWLHVLRASIIGSSFPIFLYSRKYFCHVSLLCFFLKTLFRCFSAEHTFML